MSEVLPQSRRDQRRRETDGSSYVLTVWSTRTRTRDAEIKSPVPHANLSRSAAAELLFWVRLGHCAGARGEVDEPGFCTKSINRRPDHSQG